MRKRPYTISVSDAQKKQLLYLRQTFGERSYLIFPVADWYERCSDDFLATPKDQPNSIVIVRPTSTGHIEIRSYVKLETHDKIRRLVYGRKYKHTHVYWRKLWLPGNRPKADHLSDWLRFIPDTYHEELQQFSNQHW